MNTSTRPGLRRALCSAAALVLVALYGLFLVAHHRENAKSPLSATAESSQNVSSANAFALRNQAISWLSDGKRAEGLALLRQVQPFLATTDPEFNAWLGSAMIMQAMDVQSGLEKITVVENGLKVIDAALAQAPDNLNVRYVHANTLLSLPEFFTDQRSAAVRDLAIIVGWSQSASQPTITSAALQQTKQAIDPDFLAKTLAWASQQTGLPASDQTKLHELQQQIKNQKPLAGTVPANQESQK